MTAPSTPDRLADIEARLAVATPGPWEVVDYEVMATDIDIADCQTLADAELIAHAPADLAALVAFARRVRAVLDDHVSTNEQVFDDLDRAVRNLEAK